MKKFLAVFLVLVSVIGMTGCQKRNLNYIVKHEDHITGIVREVYDKYILIYMEHEGYPGGAECEVPLDVEYQDSMTHFNVGDVVTVYYGEGIMETYPLRVAHVYAILLDTPADHSVNEVS